MNQRKTDDFEKQTTGVSSLPSLLKSDSVGCILSQTWWGPDLSSQMLPWGLVSRVLVSLCSCPSAVDPATGALVRYYGPRSDDAQSFRFLAGSLVV